MAWLAWSRTGGGQIRDCQSRCRPLRPSRGGGSSKTRLVGRRFARDWCWVTRSRRPRSLRRQETRWVAWSPIARAQSRVRRTREVRRDSRERSSAAAPAHGAPQAGRCDSDAVLRVPAGRYRARHSSKARIRSATIAGHGLGGSPRLALARRRYGRDPAAMRCVVRPTPGGAALPGQVAGRSARDRSARAAAHVLGFYLLVTFGARSPLGQAFQAIGRSAAAVLIRRTAARFGDCQHPVRRPADPAWLRGHSGRHS